MNTSNEDLACGRLVPERPLPPYTFVPDRAPHPVSDPAGHSFGIQPIVPEVLDAKNWPASKTYLYGIDLFNARYYWESHVEWESLWLACGRKGAVATALKGLIKLAAAGVKHLEGKPAGVKTHACRAAGLWRDVAQTVGPRAQSFLGLKLGKLIDVAEIIGQDGWPPGMVALVVLLPTQGSDGRIGTEIAAEEKSDA
jgi:uncharacterized protein